MERTRALILSMVLILGLVLLRESRLGFATAAERSFCDWLARNAEVHPKEAPLALIEINDSSLSKQWPLPPIDFAMFLSAGLTFQPSVVAIEPVLAWPAPSEQAKAETTLGLRILHNQMLACPKLLLGAELGDFPKDSENLPAGHNVPVLSKVEGDASQLPEFAIVENQPLEELQLAASVGFTEVGFTNLPEPGAVARKVPLLFRYRGQVVPSFVLQSAMLWLELSPESIQIQLGSAIMMGDRLRIPIDASGRMEVDASAKFSRLGLDDLLLVASQLEAKQKPMVSPGLLQKKMLLLARSDSKAQTLRFPTGAQGSPGELFAGAMATIQTGTFPRRAPIEVDLLILGGVLLLSRWFFQLKDTGTLFVAALVAVVYLMGALSLYASNRIWLPIVLPFGLLACAVVFRLFAPAEAVKRSDSELSSSL
jgi:hypothetical protein